MANGTVKTDARDFILRWLEKEERDLAWLSRKTGINYNTLYSCFTFRNFALSEKNLKKINKVLETDFE